MNTVVTTLPKILQFSMVDVKQLSEKDLATIHLRRSVNKDSSSLMVQDNAGGTKTKFQIGSEDFPLTIQYNAGSKFDIDKPRRQIRLCTKDKDLADALMKFESHVKGCLEKNMFNLTGQNKTKAELDKCWKSNLEVEAQDPETFIIKAKIVIGGNDETRVLEWTEKKSRIIPPSGEDVTSLLLRGTEGWAIIRPKYVYLVQSTGMGIVWHVESFLQTRPSLKARNPDFDEFGVPPSKETRDRYMAEISRDQRSRSPRKPSIDNFIKTPSGLNSSA